MRDAYVEWIAEHYPTPEAAYGNCRVAAELLVAQFPESLRLVKGHYYCVAWGEREHWWCEADDGSVVDPTAAQFPSKGKGVYVELAPDAKAPTGLCPECGGYVYDGGTFCCDEHAASYMAYLATGVL